MLGTRLEQTHCQPRPRTQQRVGVPAFLERRRRSFRVNPWRCRMAATRSACLLSKWFASSFRADQIASTATASTLVTPLPSRSGSDRLPGVDRAAIFLLLAGGGPQRLPEPDRLAGGFTCRGFRPQLIPVAQERRQGARSSAGMPTRRVFAATVAVGILVLSVWAGGRATKRVITGTITEFARQVSPSRLPLNRPTLVVSSAIALRATTTYNGNPATISRLRSRVTVSYRYVGRRKPIADSVRVPTTSATR